MKGFLREVKTQKYLSRQSRDILAWLCCPLLGCGSVVGARRVHAALDSDARVIEYMPKLLDRVESDVGTNALMKNPCQYGFGL